MSDLREQTATQLRNIETATGRSIDEWVALLRASGLEKHGQLVAHLKAEHGLTHGNANLLATVARQAVEGGPADDGALLDEQYKGGKAALRPVLDAVLAVARGLGDDVEVVVQKSAVALRRSKQLGVVRAASASRVELGLNAGALEPVGRLLAASGMCTHRVDLHAPEEVDDEVVGWLRAAYERAR